MGNFLKMSLGKILFGKIVNFLLGKFFLFMCVEQMPFSESSEISCCYKFLLENVSESQLAYTIPCVPGDFKSFSPILYYEGFPYLWWVQRA